MNRVLPVQREGVALAAVVCQRHDCSNRLVPPRRKYCSDHCSQMVRTRRVRAKHKAALDDRTKALNMARLEEAASADGRGSMRRGPEYEAFVKAGGPEMVDGPKGLTHEEVAGIFGVSRVTVTHWLAAARQDAVVERSRLGWRPPQEALDALEDHVAFKDRYFTLPDGRPYITGQCHREWSEALEDAIANGLQKAIVAPPRYGKTEDLIIECLRQIIKNPNMRIAWVGVNEDRARDAVGFAMKELEFNEKLIADFCGPGGSFKPPTRSGTRWTDAEFTIATRTKTSKSATMKAFGRGGRIIGFDADVIVCDDIEDQGSVFQPAQRDKTVKWFNTDVASRKMEHTAWFYIGSRQHPEDLIGKLMDNPRWDVKVYPAHDPDCTLPEKPYEAHTDCTLAPELRSFEFLMQQLDTMTAPIFEMNFLNAPRADGMTIFPREVVEECRNYSRRLGDVPPSTRLIAGVDPSGSGSGYQSAVLWAVHVASNSLSLVDFENVQGGGVVHLRSVIERWSAKYPGLVEWVVEQNIVEDTLAHDVPLQELKKRLGFRFVPHKTGRNKWDQRMGVPGFGPYFEDKRIDLPYGDPETRGKVEVLINQFVNFTTNVNSHQTSYKTDGVMAAWVPLPTIQGWQRLVQSGMEVAYRGAGVGRDLGGIFGTEYQ